MQAVIERYIPIRRQYSDGIPIISRKVIEANVEVNTENEMVREFSGNNSDSDSNLGGESSDDSHGKKKRSSESQSIYEEPKRVRQDNDPMTINHNDEIADSPDSLFYSQDSLRCSQQSYTDDLTSSQPVIINNMLGYGNQSASEIVVMCPSQPSAIAGYAEDSSHGVNTKRKRATSNKRVANGKQPQSSSQDSNEAELSEREKQKEKNRIYARGSRERKTKKMNELEQTNKLLRSVIEIYKKAIGILYKRQNPVATIPWTNYHIPWYNNVDGESEKCQTVECLLPLEDKAFFEELGNTPFGTIIANDVPVLCRGDLLLPDSTTTRGSDMAMASNSGSMMTHRTFSNPAPNPTRMSQTTKCPSSLPHGSDYTQNTLAKLESANCAGGRQNRSKNMLHLLSLANIVKLEPNEMVHRGGLNSLQTPSSQMSIVSPDTFNLMPSRQDTTNMNNPSPVTTYLDMNSHGKRLPHSGSNFTGTQTTHKLDPDGAPATVNVLPDGPSITNLSAQNYKVSRGNDFNTTITKGMVCTEKSGNEPAFMHTADDFLLPTPVNSQRHSSIESVHQETSDLENLHSSLDFP